MLASLKVVAVALAAPFIWIYNRICHKISHFKISHLSNILREHGMALLVIFVIWEIIEDVCFPIAFLWLGKNVNPLFITGAPLSWLLCLHPIMVPATWAIWVRISSKKKKDA